MINLKTQTLEKPIGWEKKFQKKVGAQLNLSQLLGFGVIWSSFFLKKKREELLGLSLLRPFYMFFHMHPKKWSFTIHASSLLKSFLGPTRLDPRPSHPWPMLKVDPESLVNLFFLSVVVISAVLYCNTLCLSSILC